MVKNDVTRVAEEEGAEADRGGALYRWLALLCLSRCGASGKERERAEERLVYLSIHQPSKPWHNDSLRSPIRSSLRNGRKKHVNITKVPFLLWSIFTLRIDSLCVYV